MRSKMEDLMGVGERTGLRVNSDKTKIMKVMSTEVGGVRIGQDLLEEVESFQYLGKEGTAETVLEANSHGRIRREGNNLGCCKENCAKQDSLESDG